MKTIFCTLVTLFLVSAQATEMKELTLNVKAEVAVAELEVACVQYVNSEGESDGAGLFFSTKSFEDVESLAKKGFTSNKLLGKDVCFDQEKNNPLTHVFMDTFATAKETNAKILNQGGYKLMKVAFYDNAALEKKIRQEKQNAFDAL